MITFRNVLISVLSLFLAGVCCGQQGNFPSSGGGGITPVASLPATCTPGGANASVQSTVSIGGLPTGTIYNCISTNTYAPLPPGVSLTAGYIPKASSAGGQITNTLCDEGISTLNRVTCADTAGIGAQTFTATGSTSGFADFPQGSTSSAVAPCNTSNSICEQAPTAVTSYLLNKPGTAANGIITNNVATAVDTQGFSGDANHSTVVNFVASQTVGATSLCSTVNCPAGTYVVHLYIDITTACTTTGTLIPWIGYTDDAGAKGSTTTTFFGSGSGAGFVASTGTLTTTATTDYVQGAFVLRSTGAAAISYGYTSSACGSGSLAGNMYLSVVPVQ